MSYSYLHLRPGRYLLTLRNWSSFSFLERELKSFFAAREQDFFFPLVHKNLQASSLAPGANVLFYGDLDGLFEHVFASLPLRFRAWTLCTSYQSQLISRFGFRRDEVAVVPRRAFYLTPRRRKTRINKFVYAGRANVPEKRVRLAIELVSAIRTKSACDFEFHICIPALREAPVKFTFMNDVGRTPWVKIHQGLSSDWPSKFSSAAFISLSQYAFEDFGVAPLEALRAGMPCILSDWMGYRDFESERLIKIPALKKFDTESERDHARKWAPLVLKFLDRLQAVNKSGRKEFATEARRVQDPADSFLYPTLARLGQLQSRGELGFSPRLTPWLTGPRFER